MNRGQVNGPVLLPGLIAAALLVGLVLARGFGVTATYAPLIFGAFIAGVAAFLACVAIWWLPGGVYRDD